MKRKTVCILLSICVTVAITTPVMAATGEKTYITTSDTSEDGYTTVTGNPSSTSSSSSSSNTENSQTSTQENQNTGRSEEISENDKNRILDAISNLKSDDSSTSQNTNPAYVQNGRYYNTWAGRSMSISNGVSTFGDNVYNANSWKRDSIANSGSAYRSPEWDRQIGHDPYWSNDLYKYPYYNNYPYYGDGSVRGSENDDKKDEDNKKSSSNPAPNVLTYDQVYGGSSGNSNVTRGTVLSALKSSFTNSNSGSTSTASGKNATVNQSVANKTAEEQREAERNRDSGGVSSGVATSGYSYVSILGAVTPAQYDSFDTQWKKIISSDPELVNTFKTNSWKVVLTTADLNQLLFDSTTTGVVGCTVDSKKLIYINAEHPDSILHEMGHFLDYMAGEVSQSVAFKKIYDEEGKNLTTYGAENPSEFFAETYHFFITDPTRLKNNAPKSYAYLLDIKKSVTGV